MWMMGFVFLWLSSTVLLVWLYTDMEGLKSDNDQLRRENTKLVRAGDKSLEWYGLASDTGPSMASLAEAARKETAVLALGEEADDVETVRTKIAALFQRIVNDGLVKDLGAFETPALLPAMTVLYDDFKGTHERHAAAQVRAQEAEDQLQDRIEANEQQKNEFDTMADGLKGKVDELESAHASYSVKRDSEIDDFDRKMDDIRQQASRDIQKQRDLARAEKVRNEELQTRHAELQSKLGELQITPGEQLTARQPDGKIVRAIPGDDVVYIGLGRKQHLTTGLQFAVYPASGIPVDGRAKARIEVTRIHDTTAACRIVGMSPTETVVDGDLVANPVYDPTRALRFVVVGEFDLDGDGKEDRHGSDQIGGLIEDWGGEVLETLSSRVDFIVAGFQPEVPTSIGSKSTRDVGAQEQERLLQQDLDTYNRVIAKAAQLSIPVLTQEVFLRFLGY